MDSDYNDSLFYPGSVARHTGTGTQAPPIPSKDTKAKRTRLSSPLMAAVRSNAKHRLLIMNQT